jgi:hypothetical protein
MYERPAPSILTTVFDDPDFEDGLEAVLAASRRGAADAGEALATAARIADGAADSWVREWSATAGAAWAAAAAAARRVSARDHYLRAATYYAAALLQIANGSEPERERDVWRRQRVCWDRAVERLGAEPVAIPYPAGSLPGYLFRAADAAPGEPRPLVVLDGGSGATWPAAGAAAAERGYHWMVFDGPGQGAARFEQGLALRPDWVAGRGPGADAMAARADVDAGRMALVGSGRAGHLVARALVFEHRFAAAVADPGVVDLAAPLRDTLPAGLEAALARGDRVAFDRELHLAELFAPADAARLCSCIAAFGPDGPVYDRFAALAAYRLGDEAAAIATPLLVTERERERRWPGQAQRLHDRLTGPKQLVRFAAADGAAVREARIFDWLDGYLSPAPSFTAR